MSKRNDFINAELVNFDNVVKELQTLQKVQESKDVYRSLKQGGQTLTRKGANKLKARMKSGREGYTGNLLRSFSVTVKKGNAGVLAGFNKKGSHAHLVDKGTTNRTLKRPHIAYMSGIFRYVRSTGKVIGNNFWTDTRNQDTPKAQLVIMQGIEKAIDKIKSRY